MNSLLGNDTWRSHPSRRPAPEPGRDLPRPAVRLPLRAADDDAAPRLPDARVSGSGFFISPDGYVVTNNHVVENARKVTVRLNDGRELDARVVGRDPLTDLAVLKVKASGLAYVTFETAARPRVGDWVIAMGNPFGLGGTATTGIVSAYGRDIGEAYVDYLQIDAPINRGKGLRRGDVITRVNGRETSAPADVRAAVDEARRQGRGAVLLRVWRAGQSQFVPFSLNDRTND